MLIRPETPADVDAIREIHSAAFARPHSPEAVPPETGLVDDLRATPAYISGLSLVAEVGDQVVGHVISTRATVGHDASPALGLGPLGVHPAHQRTGVGSALVRATIAGADAMGEPMIVLLGDPGYYSRFGFELSSVFGIEPPEPGWAPHFQVRPGLAYDPAVRGVFTYTEPFLHLP